VKVNGSPACTPSPSPMDKHRPCWNSAIEAVTRPRNPPPLDQPRFTGFSALVSSQIACDRSPPEHRSTAPAELPRPLLRAKLRALTHAECGGVDSGFNHQKMNMLRPDHPPVATTSNQPAPAVQPSSKNPDRPALANTSVAKATTSCKVKVPHVLIPLQNR